MSLGVLRRLARCRWIPFGARDRVLRLFAPPERLRGRTFACDFMGWRYTGDLGSFIDWTVYFYGAYEHGILTLLARAADLAGPGAVAFDIGANVGQHSLVLSRHAAQVHAFEPWPAAQDRLERLMADNHVANVRLHPFALGDVDARTRFYAPAGVNLGTGSFCPGVNHNAPAQDLQVRRGDDVVGELGLMRLDVVKIDTEGYEANVLAGLRRSLEAHGPVVVVEIALAVNDGLDVAALFPAGWTLMAVQSHPEKCALRPFETKGLSMVTVLAGPADKLRDLVDSLTSSP